MCPVICLNISRAHKCQNTGVQRIKFTLKKHFIICFVLTVSMDVQWLIIVKLTTTTADTVIRNNSKPEKRLYPMHLCQGIDIPADIERDYVT